MSRDTLMSAQDIAEKLGVSLRTVYRWKADGDLPPALRVGRHLRYRPDDIDEWLERHREAVAR